MVEVFKMIFQNIDTIFDTLGASYVIKLAGVNISLGDILWGFFILSVIFTFFLVPRAGSGLGGFRNIGSYLHSERPRNDSKGEK